MVPVFVVVGRPASPAGGWPFLGQSDHNVRRTKPSGLSPTLIVPASVLSNQAEMSVTAGPTALIVVSAAKVVLLSTPEMPGSNAVPVSARKVMVCPEMVSPAGAG